MLLPAASHQASVPLSQSSPKLSIGQRGQQADHRQRNSAFANEIDLPFENVFGVVVKADDEAGHDLHAVVLNLLN